MASIRLEIMNPDGEQVARVSRPRRVHVRAGFGAMESRCFADLYDQDRLLPVQQGGFCRVIIEGRLKFCGRILSVRRQSGRDELSFFAARQPEIDLSEGFTACFENKRTAEILEEIIACLDYSYLVYEDDQPESPVIDRLDFVHHELFHAVDLLAKLSGNYLWDIGWDNRLRFRPHTNETDHILIFDERYFSLKVWRTAERVKNFLEVLGGIYQGDQLYRIVPDEESLNLYGTRGGTVIVRPVVTPAAMMQLEAALREQAPKVVFEKYLDRYDEDVSLNYGDTFRVINSGLEGVEDEMVFRVKTEEITWQPDGPLKLRYHLADMWESSLRFLSYLDHAVNELPGDYVARRVGSIRLDFSALDCPAHLD
jgi:hypothetical protein